MSFRGNIPNVVSLVFDDCFIRNQDIKRKGDENMASVTGTTSSSILSSLSSKRFSGLASGLDTDELVKNMTSRTRSKIAKMEQQKQKTQWKMEAYRSINSKLIAFQNKFTSYTSSTNLRSAAFYSKSVITSVGENSKYVKASGSGDNIGNATIAGVKQLAAKTSYVSAAPVSGSTLTGAEIDATQEVKTSKLAGQSFSFTYNNSTYTVKLDDSKDYASMDDVVAEINLQLQKTDYARDDKKLSEYITASNENGKLKIDFASEEVRNIGNTIEITKVGSEIESVLGLTKGSKASGQDAIFGKEVTDDAIADAVTKSNMGDLLAEESFTFVYNGKSTTIKLGKAEELKGADGNFDMEKVKTAFQDGLNEAFGSGRVTVGWDGKQLSFETTKPDGTKDTTSVLTLSNGSSKALKALGLKAGASNRLNTSAALADSGFNFKGDGLDKLTDYSIRIVDKISGKEYVIDRTTDGKKFDANTSMKEIMEAINASDAKVKVTYLSTADKLSITSTQDGASGDFAIIGTGGMDADGTLNNAGTYNLGQAIFGEGIQGKDVETSEYAVTKGQDAIIWVDYDGEGGADPVEVSRSSNTFDLNGMNVTVTGTFNVTETGELDKSGQAVSFEAKADVDKIAGAVKEMIDAYNEIIELSNKMVSEKPNRDYAPLTNEQKEEMSEDEIKNWNEKAQAGMLFNDSDLRNFTNEIRFLFESDAETIKELEEIGITSATSYSNNGKINFDESAFKNAVENNLDTVKKLFTATEKSYTDENGQKVVTQEGGIMNNIKTVFDKYAAVDTARKGVFVQAAGATESPLSMLDNFLQKQMDGYNDMISTLQDKLKDEAERYYNRFSSLEVYINNMNSQSSWLSQQLG